MSKYDVNFKRLGLLLLPTFWRKPLLTALVYVIVSPLGYLHTLFLTFRQESNFRLTHNGQVCHLRAVLNDLFDPQSRRITIADIPSDTDGFILHQRSTGQANSISLRGSDMPSIINRRGFGGANRYDFEIRIPAVLQAHLTTARINAIVNTYKLATKRFTITYISNL